MAYCPRTAVAGPDRGRMVLGNYPAKLDSPGMRGTLLLVGKDHFDKD